MELPTDYSFDAGVAESLAGASRLPLEVRREILADLDLSNEQLVDLLANVLGLANSVASNCREMAEIVLICFGNCWPKQAEDVNLPTVPGALKGAALAAGIDQDSLCPGCAFRLGTIANQSPSTTLDADSCAQDQGGSGHFYCHEGIEEGQEPTQACAGYAQTIGGKR